MASSPNSSVELIDLVRKSGLASDSLDGWLRENPKLPQQVKKTAAKLVADGVITPFHAKHMLAGKYKGFILGTYRVLDEIGRGGMGTIFLAEHLTMKRRVAIKVLPADKAGDEESRERFYREARVVAALDHPNVVHAYDIGRNGDTHFMVMEFIDGESLEQLLRRKGPLDPRLAADYVAQAARGLQHAHERGLIHRDIKPGNLILDRQGVIKVLDMGLARFFEESSTLTTELCSGSVIGTADYMAPEQAVNSHEVDIRADIYSLGVTLYALLTGHPPFAEANVAQKLLAHHMRQPEPIQLCRPEVPDELCGIVMKMMAKAPADRYQTPGAAAEALADWLHSSELSTALTAKIDNTIIQRSVPARQAAVPKKNQSWLFAGVGGGMIVVVVVAALALSGKSGTDTAPDKSIEAVEAARESKPPTASATGRIAPKVEPVPTPRPAPAVAVQPPKAKPKSQIYGADLQFDTKGNQLQRLALSPNDKLLAGAGTEGDLMVWDFESGNILLNSPVHEKIIRYVGFSPSGGLLASAGQDGWIRIWNTQTWAKVREFRAPDTGLVKCIAFSPDEKVVFAGHGDGLGRFWNVETGQIIRTCARSHKLDHKPETLISWVAWTPDGQFVYTASCDGSVVCWDASTGAERYRYTCEGDTAFNVVLASPDSKMVIVVASNGHACQLKPNDGTKIRELTEPVNEVVSGAVSRDGSLVVLASMGGKVRVWDIGTGTIYFRIDGLESGVPGCAITSDGRRIAASTKANTLFKWALP